MALQNLMGDLSLEATQQQIVALTQQNNDTLAQVKALAETMQYLISVMESNMPRITNTKRLIAEVETSASNSPYPHTYITATNNPILATTYYLTQAPWQNSTTAAATMLYSNITVS